MKERPMIFNSEMVKAILEGRKTQTRRPIKVGGNPADIRRNPDNDKWYGDRIWSMRTDTGMWGDYTQEKMLSKCPFGSVGDRIWVRETFYADPRGEFTTFKADYPQTINDAGDIITVEKDHFKWKPSIHMPREHSRITLEITGVRVEKIQDDMVGSINNCNKEGCFDFEHPHVKWIDRNGWERNHKGVVGQFISLWNSIYSKTEYKWSNNPYVWVIDYKVVEEK